MVTFGQGLVNAGALLFILAIVSTAIFGRAFREEACAPLLGLRPDSTEVLGCVPGYPRRWGRRQG